MIIKQEGKAEKQALDVATKELAEVQKLQKVAIKVRCRLLPSFPRHTTLRIISDLIADPCCA